MFTPQFSYVQFHSTLLTYFEGYLCFVSGLFPQLRRNIHLYLTLLRARCCSGAEMGLGIMNTQSKKTPETSTHTTHPPQLCYPDPCPPGNLLSNHHFYDGSSVFYGITSPVPFGQYGYTELP